MSRMPGKGAVDILTRWEEEGHYWGNAIASVAFLFARLWRMILQKESFSEQTPCFFKKLAAISDEGSSMKQADARQPF